MAEMTLSKWISDYRTRHKLSLRGVALKSGISYNYIYLLEQNVKSRSGRKTVPSLGILVKLAAMAHEPVENLIHIVLKEGVQ